MVEKSVDRLLELRKHTRVRGLTVLVGGDNARFYNLPEEYDLEMDKHAKRFVSEGVTVIDPASLLMRTTRPDGFHMEVTDDNVTTSLQWWKQPAPQHHHRPAYHSPEGRVRGKSEKRCLPESLPAGQG